jgi:CheY-like chemotaxis protein
MDEPPNHLRSALVVDDDAINRMDACAILEEAGYEAREAISGDDALRMLEEADGRMGLLFTDVEMPTGSIDGFALARDVAERWPDIGILVASGRRNPAQGELPRGAIFVPKPFSGDVVHDRLRQLLPNHRRPKALRDGPG